MTPYYHDEAARITIYCGDALAVLASLPDASVDALVCDPPYCSGGMVRGDRMQSTRSKYQQTNVQKFSSLPEFTGDTRDQRSFGFWSALWLSESLRATKPGSPCAVFSDWRQLPTVTDAMQAGGWVWRGVFVWDKTGSARPSVGRFANQAEYVVWGSNGPMPNTRNVGALPGVVAHPPLYEGRDDKQHIAQKPLPIMNVVVSICTPGGVVLDPFLGSGSTLVAAKTFGYRAIGVDISEANCEIAAKRLQQSVMRFEAAS